MPKRRSIECTVSHASLAVHLQGSARLQVATLQGAGGPLLYEAQHPVLHTVYERLDEALTLRHGCDLEHAVPLLIADACFGCMVGEGIGRNLPNSSAGSPQQCRRHHLQLTACTQSLAPLVTLLRVQTVSSAAIRDSLLLQRTYSCLRQEPQQTQAFFKIFQ